MTGEFRDGGYWYVVPSITDDDGQRPALPAGVPYAVWYSEDFGLEPGLATVRAPFPVNLDNAMDITLDDVLSAAGLDDVLFARWGGV